MSDTTDTFATGAPASVTVPSGPVGPPVRIPARDLLHLAQGLYFIFWGVLISVIVSLQIIFALWLRTYSELFLAAGVVSIVVGSWRLSQTRLEQFSPALADTWRHRAQTLLWLSVLLVYFCALFYMWRHSVGNLYLQINALGFVVTGIAYLIMLSRTVASLALALGSTELARESHVFNAINLALIVLPFLGALGYVVMMKVRHHTNLVVEFTLLLANVNVLTGLIFLLPFSLTLSMVWAAKDVALRLLAGVDERS